MLNHSFATKNNQSDKHGPAMWNSCVQAVHKRLHTTGITTQIKHRAAYKNSASVHNQVLYAPEGLLANPLKNVAYTQPHNRLFWQFIPIVHRPYKNKHEFKLSKYIIERQT